MTFLHDFLYNYINYWLIDASHEMHKLVTVIDLQQYYSYQFEITSLNQSKNLLFCDFQDWFDLTIKQFSKDKKFFLFLNCLLVKLFFFKITPITFWLIPTVYMFICGLVLLFFIKTDSLNTKIWVKTKFLLLLAFLYQLMLVYLYTSFLNQGIILKVGLAGLYILPFNLPLAKLISLLLIIFILYFTIIFYCEYYWKILLLIKPELCSVVLFLGFASGMVFLQNDLFSMFLYFEIISFCIYGLLFFQKWTNTQLHSLVRYVLFSLWASTCYILGIVFYLSSYNISTSLIDLTTTLSHLNLTSWLPNFSIIIDFELVLAITFFLIYFLFKLGVGPFYTWTIEVYNSCSTSALLVVSLVPKLIYFPMLFFLLFFNFIEFYQYWSNLLLGLAIITIFIGAFGILLTDKLKEIYAWSSVIHTGNLLIMVSCISSVSLTFLIFYLISYYLISIGYIVLITSLWNNITGRFIKNINELYGLHYLQSTFYFFAVILLASAAGFTPFLSFFMKFSLLSIISSHYGLLITLIVGLLNIVGSVAYLWMLWNIISFNTNIYNQKIKIQTIALVELNMTYPVALIFNIICVLIIFSFIFYKDFITYFTFFSTPYYMWDISTLYLINHVNLPLN